MRIREKDGFTLIEVMLAMGLSAMVMVTLISMLEQQNRGQKLESNRFHSNNLAAVSKMALDQTKICSLNLKDVQINLPPPGPGNPDPTVQIPFKEYYDGNRFVQGTAAVYGTRFDPNTQTDILDLSHPIVTLRQDPLSGGTGIMIDSSGQLLVAQYSMELKPRSGLIAQVPNSNPPIKLMKASLVMRVINAKKTSGGRQVAGSIGAAEIKREIPIRLTLEDNGTTGRIISCEASDIFRADVVCNQLGGTWLLPDGPCQFNSNSQPPSSFFENQVYWPRLDHWVKVKLYIDPSTGKPALYMNDRLMAGSERRIVLDSFQYGSGSSFRGKINFQGSDGRAFVNYCIPEVPDSSTLIMLLLFDEVRSEGPGGDYNDGHKDFTVSLDRDHGQGKATAHIFGRNVVDMPRDCQDFQIQFNRDPTKRGGVFIYPTSDTP